MQIYIINHNITISQELCKKNTKPHRFQVQFYLTFLGGLLNISICKNVSCVISFTTQKTQISTIQGNLKFFLDLPQGSNGYTLLEVQILYVDYK